MFDKTFNQSILIVDDIPENLYALEKLLKKLDIEIILAKSGNEALAATLSHDFSLILLDINMPEMSGYEVLDLLKKNEKTTLIPIIFITAQDKNDEIMIKGYDKGAIDFIFKPINATILTYKIKVLLELFRMKKSLDMILSMQASEKPLILIVDDNNENILALELILKKLDVKIMTAESGNEALSLALYNNFALILMDVQMPEMDGYEVADILKSDEKTENIPIIFLTAIDRDEVKEIKGYSKGAVDFIFKPLNEYVLISKVKVFMEIFKIKSGLESLVDERNKELISTNIKLRDEISKHKETAKELLKAKSYLNSIFNSISMVLIGLDSNGKITEMNKEAEKVSKIKSKNAVGKDIKEVFPFYRDFFDDITLSINSGKPIEKIKIPVEIDHEYHIDNFAIYPLNVGGVLGALIKADDITEQVKIDEMMIQSEKMLTVGGLAAGMAHEINNPLAGMLQTSQVMENRLGKNLNNKSNIKAAEEAGTTIQAIQKFMDSRGIITMLNHIRESGERATKIVKNMLNFARKSDSDRSTHNLSELIENTIDLAYNDYDLKKEFDFRQIKITKEYEKDLPAVPCEGPKIQQVILNILRNGSEAMQEGNIKDPEFIIKTLFDSKNKMDILEIHDNGPGMSEKVCKRIFEPFYTTKPVGVGTGLGMSVSYFIITQNHGGKMLVESLVDERNKELISTNIKLRDEISKHKETAKELLKAKSYLNSIFNSISMVLIGLDSNGKITEMNKEAEKVSKIKSKNAASDNSEWNPKDCRLSLV